jgi:hypothetical protein
MDSRTLSRFLALGPFVVGAECVVARISGWMHPSLLESWSGAALALACWEWSAVAWLHGWLKNGGAERLCARAPQSLLARLLIRRRD